MDPAIEPYLNKYYPDIKITNDFRFQELVRTLVAKDSSPGELEITTVWYSYKHLIEALKTSDISKEFREFIDSKLAGLASFPENIYNTIRDIFMWPISGYPEWKDYDDGLLTLRANSLVIPSQPHCTNFTIKCKLELVHGKICATLPGLSDALHKRMNEFGGFKGLDSIKLEKNNEGDNITLVNYDVLAAVMKKSSVQSPKDLLIVKLFDVLWDKIDIRFFDIKHTISLDLPKFSICCIISLDSNALRKFVHTFNIIYETNIAPKLHITFAVRNRASCNV